jgi:hypothetical protein
LSGPLIPISSQSIDSIYLKISLDFDYINDDITILNDFKSWPIVNKDLNQQPQRFIVPLIFYKPFGEDAETPCNCIIYHLYRDYFIYKNIISNENEQFIPKQCFRLANVIEEKQQFCDDLLTKPQFSSTTQLTSLQNGQIINGNEADICNSCLCSKFNQSLFLLGKFVYTIRVRVSIFQLNFKNSNRM